LATISKIGIVFSFDFLQLYGGSIQRLRADITALTALYDKVEVIFPTVGGKGALKEKGNELHASFWTYPNCQKLSFLPQKIRMLLSQYGQVLNPFFYLAFRKHFKDVQVIFAHSPSGFLSGYLAARRKVPVIYTAHNCEYRLIRQVSRNPLVHRITYALEKHACTRSLRILCVSDKDKKDIQSVYSLPPEKLIVVPNTVDVDFFYQTRKIFNGPEERKKLGIEKSAFVLIFTGRMDFRPNSEALHFVLEKLAISLEKSNRLFRLLVVGTQIPSWCLKNRSENIKFCSDVPDMRRFFAVADAAIVPLFSGGGTRIKILEAFAAMVPVISTATGCEGIECRDGEHLLVSETTAEDFVRKAALLAQDNALREKLVAGAYKLVMREYSTTTAGRRFAELIAEIEKAD
jgi:glycosyltransferase involved in cell wall biosynthesis